MNYNLYNIKNSPFKGRNYCIVTSDYGNRSFYNDVTGKYESYFHNGIDLVGSSEIIAASSGRVVETRNTITGYSETYSMGNYVIIYHGDNIFTVYCHMRYGSVCVSVGDEVSKGDVIGIMGETGHATGVHLHFGVRVGSSYVSPKEYLLGYKELPDYCSNNTDEEDKYTDYLIKSGDTLSEIALKYNTTYQELARINNIENPNLIITGTHIKVPVINSKEEKIYVVESGDNLSYIANKFNMTWQELYEKNKDVIGDNPNLIYRGQVLKI